MSERTEKIAARITECAAHYVKEHANTDPLITVTDTRVTPDGKKATVLVTTYPSDREEDARVFFSRNASDFRSYLKTHAALKHIPHISVSIDYGERHRQHIDDIAKETE